MKSSTIVLINMIVVESRIMQLYPKLNEWWDVELGPTLFSQLPQEGPSLFSQLP
jgi:hypothetical protein